MNGFDDHLREVSASRALQAAVDNLCPPEDPAAEWLDERAEALAETVMDTGDLRPLLKGLTTAEADALLRVLERIARRAAAAEADAAALDAAIDAALDRQHCRSMGGEP
jgi:hypothetical protein